MGNADLLIDGYLDGELGPDGLKQLEGWIMESSENTNTFVRRVFDHQECRSCSVGDEKLDLLTLSFESECHEASLLLSELLEIERRSVPPKLVDLTDLIAEKEAKASIRLDRPIDDEKSVVIRRVIVVPRWLAWGGAIAAMLAFITLIVAPTGNRSGNGVEVGDDSFAEQPVPPVVAHMISSVDAAWRTQPHAGALRQGEVLELLKGSAELQFNSAARVTISAGTRLVLTGENACEMQGGVLSGLCPPGAEGFEVGLPGGLVRDLGTEFSIEIEEGGLSKIIVTDGLVEIGAITPDGARTQEIEIRPGMVGEIDREAGLVRVTDQQELLLLSTAAGKAVGKRDGNWLVTAISTDPNYGISPSVVLDFQSPNDGSAAVPWDANTNASGWIGVSGQGGNVPEGQVTTFCYGFNFPEGAALDGLTIHASIWADDSLEAVLVNGTTVLDRDAPLLKGVHYLNPTMIEIPGAWRIGENKIEFKVKNKTGEPNPFHHSGLRVEFDPVRLDVTRIYRPDTEGTSGKP